MDPAAGRTEPSTPGVRLVPLTLELQEAAVRALARAFATNPLHVAAFGPSRLHANEAFFRTGLALMKGPKWAAIEDSRVLGFVHWVPSPACRFSGAEKLRTLPALVHGLGLRSALRVGSWLSAWRKHDPDEAHSHLGPIGVEPDAQGRRIGRLLMERYCGDLDRTSSTGYLETDRPENVDFYRRFGFEVAETERILGVDNFFMRRLPGARAGEMTRCAKR